jgi:hypothetical protein
MPPNDKDGRIVDQVMLYSELRYLVEYEFPDGRNLKVAVKLPNILNYVSPRTLEDWNSKQYDAEEEEREKTELQLLKLKAERRRKKLKKESRASLPAKPASRKRKRTPVDEVSFKAKKSTTPVSGKNKAVGHPRGPGRRNEPEEIVTFTSPRQSQRSQQQPSLSAPSGGLANRTVLDTDSEDEDSVATDMALEHQLKGSQITRLNLQSSRSNSPPVSKRNTRSRSTSKPVTSSREETRSPSPSVLKSTPHRRYRRVFSSVLPGSAVAATSSRQALKEYEDLERKNAKRQSIADKYSLARKSSQSQMFQEAHDGLGGQSGGLAQAATEDEETDEPEEEEEEDDEAGKEEEEEYEVHQILSDEIRLNEKGEEVIWYLIDWVGDWPNSWEPEENVGTVAIEVYNATKRKKRDRIGRAGSGNGNGYDSSPNSLFVSETGKGKGKDAQRGQVIDDDDDDDDED